MSRLLSPRRLLGVDLARGLALVGMMSVHIYPSPDADGAVAWADRISAGRASALFAVLAGLSLILAYAPPPGRPLEPGVRRAVLVRAAFIAAIGLVLGMTGSGVAVILVHYAALFAVGTVFLTLSAGTLMAAAAGWLLVSPVVSQLLRMHLPEGPTPSPSLDYLLSPVDLVTSVLFTGTYPVLQWTSYLLVGMAVGRLPLRRVGTSLQLLGAGLLLAGAAKAASAIALGPAGGLDQLTVPAGSFLATRSRSQLLESGFYGTTPTSSWWWLTVSVPHSGTPLDLLHTTGTALAVLGGSLLVASALHGRWRWLVLPVAAAGSMTLTLYTTHVLALAIARGGAGYGDLSSPTVFWSANVLGALAFATAWQFTDRRGPLEAVAAELSAAARTSAGSTAST